MVIEKPFVTPFGHYSKMQAATALSVDRKTIYRYCRDGKLPVRFNKMTGACFIMGSDIIRLWEGK